MDNQAEYNLYLGKAMALCAGREMCSYDIMNKLTTWGATGELPERILNKLISERFIDEERYAAAFVRDKFRYNKWGRIKISVQLRQKKIPESIISQALGSIDDATYTATVRNIIMSHKKSVRAKNQYDLRAKLLRYGLSKGFESYILYDLLNDVGEEG